MATRVSTGLAEGIERLRRPELGVVIDGRLKELLLYPGNFCNRDCAFCTVLGSPRGWYHQDAFRNDCGRCYPVVTTKGEVHACPFAVEIADPHFHPGDMAGDPRRAVRNFEAFFRWIDAALMPYARSHRRQPCSVCRTRRHELPLPAFEAEGEEGAPR